MNAMESAYTVFWTTSVWYKASVKQLEQKIGYDCIKLFREKYSGISQTWLPLGDIIPVANRIIIKQTNIFISFGGNYFR